jgi:N-acetylated-alpha-linked acidic dipeptidase
MSDVYAAVGRLGDAGEAFDEGIERVIAQGSRWLAGRDAELRDINKEIYQTERDLAKPDGLPRREWFRHTIYAPGLYTGYGVKTMPGIRESLEWGELDQSQNQASSVAAAIVRMAERVERLVEKLGEL